MSKLYDYCQKHDNLYLPHVAEKFGLGLEECVYKVCGFWSKLNNPRMVENQIITGFSNQHWYKEICDTPYRRGNWIKEPALPSYCISNQKKDQHISVFSHNQKWIEHISNKGRVGGCVGTKVTTDWFWIEIDRKLPDGSADLDKAIEDGLQIKKNISGHLSGHNVPINDVVKLFYSGNNSTHLAINASLFGSPVTSQIHCGIGRPWYNLAHRLAGNVRFVGGIKDVWLADDKLVESIFLMQYPEIRIGEIEKQKMRQCLETIDPNIYSVNSLIRQPWSIHESSGNKKELIMDNSKVKCDIEPLVAKNYPPYLAHLWLESFKNKRKSRKSFDSNYSDDYIISEFEKHVPDFREEDVGDDGWCNNCFSAFYESDSNPSVAVNIKNGYYHDHGYPLHSFHFDEFLTKIKGKNNGDI